METVMDMYVQIQLLEYLVMSFFIKENKSEYTWKLWLYKSWYIHAIEYSLAT